MIGSPENAVLATAQIIIALALFHFAIPSVIRNGRKKAFKIWALALTLALFGVDRFTAFMSGSPTSFMTLSAHCWLTVYGALRFAHIAGRGLTAWGDTIHAEDI